MSQKMNPEIKAEWVAALRSGEYEQGKGALRQDGKLCCLGVLCEVAHKHGVGEWKASVPESNVAGLDTYVGAPYDESTAVLPEAVSKWAGLRYFPGTTGNPKAGAYGLTTYNDDIGKTFPQIADLIEEYL